MTLVYRSSKEQVLKPVNDLGPGSYNLTSNNKKPNKRIQQSSVFASSTKRDPFESKKSEKKLKQAKRPSERDSKNEEQKVQNTLKNDNVLNPPITKNYPDCQYVFNSKVERFPSDNEVKQREKNSKQAMFVEEFKKILLKDMNKIYKGKLVKTKDKIEKQNELRGQNYQFFPSIPNWDHSYGYRFDSSSGQWIQNQNPNLMRQLLESQKQPQKNNYALGPGYYVIKNKDHSSNQGPKRKEEKQKSIVQSIVYPRLQAQHPAYHSIQQDQFKLKARIRHLGKSTLKKTQQQLSVTQNHSNSQLFDFEKNKRQNLVMGQMLKKFGEFIPEQDKQSAANYIEMLKEKKQKELKQKLSSNLSSSKDSIPSHFLSKSYRFSSKNNELEDTISIAEQVPSNLNLNKDSNDTSTMIIKSHNRKQPFKVREERFKENYKMDLIGPGTYMNENLLEKNKSSPCLNLKQKRFDNEIGKNDIPGPGDYDVTQSILKKENNLGNAYSYYKQLQKQDIKKNMKPQESMEALYQSWGRQMNYIAKLDHSLRPQQSYVSEQGSRGQCSQKSFVKVRKELERSMNHFQASLEANVAMNQERKIQSKNDKASKIYPKITKHLYEYKQPPDDKKVQNMGPGKYQTRPQMIKKTFNVTYT